MNPVERVIRRVDTAQQRHRGSAFIFGVIKKYGDDNGGVLAANMAHSAFVSVFPLLLILVTVLVQVASGSPALQHEVLNAVSHQFPAIGKTLVGQITALHRASAAGLVIGLLILVWGATGLAQAGMFTMEQVWNLPGPARPGYLPRLGRCALFLGVLAVGLVASMLLASLVTYGHHGLGVVILAQALAVAANVGLYLASFRVLTPKGVPARSLVPGAVAGGIAWTVLLAAGAYVVHHDLRTASVYGIFATVLVLLAWIYLGVQVDRLRRRGERGAHPAPVAAYYRAAATGRSRPGVDGTPGPAEPAARGADGAGVLHRPAGRHAAAGPDAADARGGHPARAGRRP